MSYRFTKGDIGLGQWWEIKSNWQFFMQYNFLNIRSVKQTIMKLLRKILMVNYVFVVDESRRRRINFSIFDQLIPL